MTFYAVADIKMKKTLKMVLSLFFFNFKRDVLGVMITMKRTKASLP